MTHLELNLEELIYLKNELKNETCPETIEAILFNIEDLEELIRR